MTHCTLYNRYVYILLLLLIVSAVNRLESQPFVISRGAHEKVWQQTNETGEVTARFTEIATGLCRWDAITQTWLDADPTIDIRQDIDGAIADKANHVLKLASDANVNGATIDVTMPDGNRIRLKTVGLALTSLDDASSVYISEVQPSVGEKIDATTVIYRDAFAPVKADLRVRNSLSGVESDVILRERIDPAQWGLQPDNCRLEVWTEVLQSPAANIRAEQIPGRAAGDADQDQQIDFPSMSFTKGAAFRIKSQQDEAVQAVSNIRVSKEMTHFTDENATYLIEAIPFSEAADAIQSLPINDARLKPDKNRVERMIAASSHKGRARPISLALKTTKNNRNVAIVETNSSSENPGYVIDFNLGSSVTTYTFRGDTTYYASGNVAMSGTTTFEGGTIIKLAAGVSATVNGPVKFLSSPYRPAVITAVNDHTVGDKIGTAAQALPNEYSGTYALQIQNGVANLINNVVIRHSQTAISLNNTSSAEIRHAQIVSCPTAINTGSAVTLRNVLIANSTTAAIVGSNSAILSGEHVTIDIPASAARFSSSANSTLTLKNSIVYGGVNTVNYSKISTLDTWPSSPFLAAGAGSHYLDPAVAGARNAGDLAAVDAGLVAQLRQMTTDGPALLSGPISTATTLYPTAQRDTDALDLGYHYDALDYFFTSLAVSSTLTLAQCTSVAMYGNTGVSFSNLGSFISKGLANNLNHFVHYQMVQEQPTATGWPTLSTSSRVFFSASGTSGATAQQIAATFCDFSPGGGSFGLCAMTPTSGTFFCNDFSISRSSLRNIGFGSQFYGQVASSGVLCLTNNCWERCSFTLYNSSTAPYTMRMYNNLFWKGAVAFIYSSTGTTWTAYDNLFDSETLSSSGTFSVGNNAFVYPLNNIGGVGNKNPMSADYQSGPLGRFYYPSTGANLATLINVGSRTVGSAGLAHFGVTPSKDSGTVDIGFHYATVENVWVDDSLPPNAAAGVALPRDEPFNWVGTSPTAASGFVYHKATALPSNLNIEQSYFANARRQLTIRPGDTMFAYVYVGNANVQSIMLQWLAGDGWDHRAYWGLNNDPTLFSPKTYIGSLPTVGSWVRLEIPASLVGLENQTVSGMGFTFDGATGAQVSWDRAGTTAPAREVSLDGTTATVIYPSPVDSDNDGVPDYIEDSNGDGLLTTGETDWQRRPLALISPILR